MGRESSVEDFWGSVERLLLFFGCCCFCFVMFLLFRFLLYFSFHLSSKRKGGWVWGPVLWEGWVVWIEEQCIFPADMGRQWRDNYLHLKSAFYFFHLFHNVFIASFDHGKHTLQISNLPSK